MPKKRSTTTVPTKTAAGTWGFTLDIGPGLLKSGEWRERRQIRREGYATKQQAQEVLDDLRRSKRRGTFVEPSKLTVEDYLVDEWLPLQQRKLAPTAWESYERNVRLHITPYIGQLALQQLDPVTINGLYNTLLTSGRRNGSEPGLSARTTRYVAVILRAALKDAVLLRRLEINPADAATPPSAKAAKSPEMKTWTGSELASFLARTSDDRYGPPWTFLALTGCRRGEALGLRWSDLDLANSSASFRQQVVPLTKASGKGREARIVAGTKGSDARVIELDQRTVAMLKAWKAKLGRERLLMGAGFEDHDLVFPRPDGRPHHPEAFSKTFDRRVRQEAFSDLPTIRLHDLRHTWATLALEAGVDVAVVSKRLGHSSPVVTWAIYQHVRKGMQTDAAERVAASIFGVI